jgi:hypothetical protein
LPSFAELFPTLPKPLLSRLESTYSEVKLNFYEGKYEPAELNGAKFCEVVFRILEWYTTKGNYTPFGAKVRDFGQAVRRFESMSTFDESVRTHIPKVLDALYGIRNKRGVGHVGAGVNPNYMDSVFVVSACDWVLAELVRLLHGDEPAKAQKMIEDLVTKKVPLIWTLGNVRRVLDPTMTAREQTLVLLYAEYPKSVPAVTLGKWVEYSNIGVYVVKVVEKLHSERLVEYEKGHKGGSGKVTLSPLGRKYVEKNLGLSL